MAYDLQKLKFYCTVSYTVWMTWNKSVLSNKSFPIRGAFWMNINILPSPHDTQTTVANVKHRTNFNHHIAVLLYRLALSGCVNKPLFSKDLCGKFPSTCAYRGKRIECFPSTTIKINVKIQLFSPLLQPSIAYTTTRALKTFSRPVTTTPDAFHTSARFKLDSLTSTFSERSVFAVNPTIPNRVFEFLQAFVKPIAKNSVFGAPKISFQISLD